MEAAETMNKQLVSKLAPKTIEYATNMKQKRAKKLTTVVPNQVFFQDVISNAKRVTKTLKTLV